LATFTLSELRKKFGRIETFVGKLSRGDPFITKNGKPYYANTVLFLGANGKESVRFTPRSDAEVTKAIQFLRNGAMASNSVFIGVAGDDASFIPISNLQITGEFGFQGRGYNASRESSLVQNTRRKLAVVIAQNRGPISLVINNVKHWDICDVIGYQGKDSLAHADIEFIDRWGNSIVFLGNELRERSESESEQILSSSSTLRSLIPFLQRKFEHGLEGGDSFYRKISSDDKQVVLKFLYGLGYNGSKNYSPYNVSMVHKGQFSIVRATSSTYRLQGDVLENGDLVYGSSAPVILIDYSPGSRDFGIENARIRLDRLDGKGNKEI
jgi:hypothetical protein